MLQSGHELLGAEKLAKRVIIVCPTSLVGNWDSECQKWLKVPPPPSPPHVASHPGQYVLSH